MMRMCSHCIEAVRSRGEKLMVLVEPLGEGKCDWCDEEDELYAVLMGLEVDGEWRTTGQ